MRFDRRFQLSLPVCHISVNFIVHSNELPRIYTQWQIDERLVVRHKNIVSVRDVWGTLALFGHLSKKKTKIM